MPRFSRLCAPCRGAREDPEVARGPEDDARAKGRGGGEEARGAEAAGEEGARGLVQAARGDHHQDQVVQQVGRTSSLGICQFYSATLYITAIDLLKLTPLFNITACTLSLSN